MINQRRSDCQQKAVERRKKNNNNVPHVEVDWEGKELHESRDNSTAKGPRPLRTADIIEKSDPALKESKNSDTNAIL